jgi:hypothetical protein
MDIMTKMVTPLPDIEYNAIADSWAGAVEESNEAERSTDAIMTKEPNPSLLDIVTTTTTEAIGMTGAMQPEEVAQRSSNKKIEKATPDFAIWTKDLVSAIEEIYYKTIHPC